MERDELASKLDALEIGDCLSIALDQFIALFGATDRGPDEAAIKRAVAFAEEHRCRFLYYEFMHREPEFFKTIC
jgi:hypothetical protein